MVRPKKHLGQHFLQDTNIASKIVHALDPGCRLVLEIGPGRGILTAHLLKNPAIDPYFIEVDPEAAGFLRSAFPGISNRLIEADFLRYDLSQFPPADKPGPSPSFCIIGNFPYNISSQILFRVLENRNRIAHVVGMFQKEVAERLTAPPGSKTYGILSVLLSAFYTTEYLFTVNETVFYPPPKVRSAVIRLRRNETTFLACDESLFFTVVKTAFNQRRKTLRNALRLMPGFQSLCGYGELDPMLGLRAEQLSVENFVKLTRAIEPREK